jgi:hypothetical protein
VVFWAPPSRIDLLISAAQSADCGLENGVPGGSLELYADGLRKFLDFADAINAVTSKNVSRNASE